MDLRPFENISVTLFCLFCAVIVVYYLRIKHKERMEMIKLRALNPQDDDLTAKTQSLLGKAVLAISLALGLLTGMELSMNYSYFPSLVLYFICILFFCGIGLLVCYIIVSRVNEDDHR